MGRPRKGGPGAGLIVAGCIAGHALAYAALSVPVSGIHHYWRGAIVLAGLGGLAGIVRSTARAYHSDVRPPSIASMAARLFFGQAIAFCGLETAERVGTGASVAGLLTHHILVAGILAQLVVAVSAAVALRLLWRAAAAVARALRVRTRPRAVRPMRRVVILPSRSLVLAGATGLRGPPAVAAP